MAPTDNEFALFRDAIEQRLDMLEKEYRDLRTEIATNDKRVTTLYVERTSAMGDLKDLIIDRSEATSDALANLQISALQRKDDLRMSLKAQIVVTVLSVFLAAVLAVSGTLFVYVATHPH